LSNHILEKNNTIRHEEYLHNGTDDPRRLFAETLLKTLGEEGSIVVYSGFELSRIRELVEIFPDLSKALLSLEHRIVDLLALVRKYCYHPAFHGSFSIKSVLPALVPGLGYDDLEIKEGGTASLAYSEIINVQTTPKRRSELRANLLKYCERDTEAIVKLIERLRGKQMEEIMENQFKKIKDFYIPVLKILKDAGKEVHVNDVCDTFLSNYQSKLDPSFFTEIKDGDVKWRDWVNRVGYQLTKLGYIARGSKRGYWLWTGKEIPPSTKDF
jgi:hypothetical protein